MASQQDDRCPARVHFQENYLSALSTYHLALYALSQEYSLDEMCRRAEGPYEASVTALEALRKHELEHGCAVRYSTRKAAAG
jgi:hypothetical protein